MAYNQNNNFWDFIRSFDNNNNNNNGDGVDRPSQPPGAWPFGGLSGHPPPPPPPADPEHGAHPHHPFGPPPYGPGPHPHHHHPPHPPFWGTPFAPGFVGHPRCFRGGPGPRGGRHGRCGRRERRGGNEEGEQHHGGPFDFAGFLNGLASHPVAQQYRQYFEQMAGQQSGEANRDGNDDDEESFTPPIDVFTTETHFVLHVALPGAKKEDVGINWDNEKGVLNVAGVIYRPGDEEFLKTLTQSERRVGVFERAIKLPPPGNSDEKDEVDGDAITAKLEDGVLLVRVPKVEKEWTDVKKVDIE